MVKSHNNNNHTHSRIGLESRVLGSFGAEGLVAGGLYLDHAH